MYGTVKKSIEMVNLKNIEVGYFEKVTRNYF
jgi:hypothetical protein